MKHAGALVVLTYLALSPPAMGAHLRDGKLAPWVPLYNGRDLSGWHAEGSGAALDAWQPSGEVLKCLGGKSGYLATDREYGDFELRLAFRATRGANSGVGLRFPRGGWPSTGGTEIQILHDSDPRNRGVHPNQLCGAIYSFVAPRAHPARSAGKWNRMRIRCNGSLIGVWINDVQVIDEDLSKHDEKGKGPLPLSKRPRSGLIGLQCHNDPIDFRDVEIREIVPSPASH